MYYFGTWALLISRILVLSKIWASFDGNLSFIERLKIAGNKEKRANLKTGISRKQSTLWRALFSWNTRFETRPFALLPTNYIFLTCVLYYRKCIATSSKILELEVSIFWRSFHIFTNFQVLVKGINLNKVWEN